ncbi:MAG: hypothetical protein NT164_08475 [Verrucomicrobiae bacterium]|nr:hypothetical protein [Verrucomicrobiae bacterium]
MAPISSSLSLGHFEDFIKRNPDAKNIVVSNDGGIAVNSSADDQDQVRTKAAFKEALEAKYPDQVDLVDQAWSDLKPPEKSWSAHVIGRVIDQAAENADLAVWRDVEEEEKDIYEKNDVVSHIPIVPISKEAADKIDGAVHAYSEAVARVVVSLPLEERAVLQEITANLAVAGTLAGLTATENVTNATALSGPGMTALAAHLNTPTIHAALAQLFTTISASLPHAAVLPMMGAAAPANLIATVSLPTAHLAVASAIMGTTAAVTSASVQVTVASAASAILPFIIAGAIAHRLYIASSRIARASSSIEHEVNNITTAMIAASLATIPAAQQALLVSAIVGGVVGHHMFEPGLIRQVVHNVRDAALGVYLVQHPDIAVALGQELQTLLISSFKAIVTAPVAVGLSVPGAITTTTTAAATAAGSTTVTATTTAATTTTAGTVTQVAPTAALHHSIAATAAHGLSTATTVVAAIIAAHPGVTVAILVGGACAMAYQYMQRARSAPEEN